MEKKAKRITIKTTADALAYLEAQDALGGYTQHETKPDLFVTKWTCSRCGGTGIYSHYHGTCWECNGRNSSGLATGTWVTLAKSVRKKELARAAKIRKATAKAEARDARVIAERGTFEAAHPGIRAALVPFLPVYDENEGYNVAPKRHRILNDIAGKLERYGSISDKAVAFVTSLLEDEAAPKPELAEGRRVLTGKVVKASYYRNDYGETLKWVVALDGADEGTRVFGSVPSAVQYADLGRRLRKGDRVEFSATVTRSDDSPDFGFASRPSKASVIEDAPEDAAPAVEDFDR